MEGIYLKNLQDYLRKLLAADERVYLIGEDIMDPYGGAFKVTKGLSTDFPKRVINTPISEAGIVGIGCGMALNGMRPIVEIMFGDFITLATDQIVNHMSKFQQMYGNQIKIPIIIRTPMGGGRGYGPTHSQSLEKLFFGIPNIKIVAPSHFHEPGEILYNAALNDESPIIFIENKLLYPKKIILENIEGLYIETINDNGYPTKIIKNYIGNNPDITIIGYGGVSIILEEILRKMLTEEINVLLCMPSLIKPVVEKTIINCSIESSRVIILEEGIKNFGWGAEVSSIIYNKLYKSLKSPIVRIGAEDSIIPVAEQLERKVLPSVEKVEKVILEVIEI